LGRGLSLTIVHASYALKEAGFETIMVNPTRTVSTDYDTSDRLYFEPPTKEDVLNIIEAETSWGDRPVWWSDATEISCAATGILGEDRAGQGPWETRTCSD